MTVFDVPLDELRRRGSYKWRAYPEDVLPAFVAEMDVALAPAVRSALATAIACGDAGYAWDDPAVAAALTEFTAARFDWQLDPSAVVLIPDVMAGVLGVLRLHCKPGDGVVVNTPVYPPFFSHIAEAGCRVVEAPLRNDEGIYVLDFDALERAFASGARVHLLCNPHNPTGRVFARSDLQRVVGLAERYDVLVLSDEIHAPLVLPGAEHVPFLTLGERAACRCIAFHSASKGWNIPGLKCAQAVATSPATRSLLGRVSEDAIYRTGYLGIVATVAAYRESSEWLDELCTGLERNRRLMSELLAERLPLVRYSRPEGSYLGWLDCRRLQLEDDPAAVFLERGRVALRPGPDFGSGGEGFVRVTMATSPPVLEEIVDRMAAAIS
ncbi:MAG: MalY/PatB family protein [Candidatus Dormibacteria bacterium]